MTPEEIKSRVTEIFKDVLDNDTIVLFRETTARDIEEWDSLAHINLIVAIEKEFKIKFDLIELKSLQNVGEMLDLIQLKIS
jgi:acyl carrier protein